jgi:hypothetical protein
MSSTVLYMPTSLDGFITGPNESPANGLGDGGDRLHEWAFPDAQGRDFDAAVATARRESSGLRRVHLDGGRGGRTWDLCNRRAAGQVTITIGVPLFILSRNSAPAWAATGPLCTT